jgi:hypothetical protein
MLCGQRNEFPWPLISVFLLYKKKKKKDFNVGFWPSTSMMGAKKVHVGIVLDNAALRKAVFLCQVPFHQCSRTHLHVLFFLIHVLGGGVQQGPLGTLAIYWPIVPAPGDYDDGEFGGMKIGRGNRSTRRKPAPAPLWPTCQTEGNCFKQKVHNFQSDSQSTCSNFMSCAVCTFLTVLINAVNVHPCGSGFFIQF